MVSAGGIGDRLVKCHERSNPEGGRTGRPILNLEGTSATSFLRQVSLRGEEQASVPEAPVSAKRLTCRP